MNSQEVIFQEKSFKEKKNTIVKPENQRSIVMIKNNPLLNLRGFLSDIFLPHGYPHSTSKDYIQYQIYDSLQAACSTIIGILATHAVLKGVGVGNENASVLAATITWVLRDGCGHLGRLLFSYLYGGYLDAYCKRWRLYADALNDVAMCFELMTQFLPADAVVYMLCLSTMARSIVGVAGSATRLAMTQHHSLHGNYADVCAKDAAQETAVNLLASLVALTLLSNLTHNIVAISVLMMLHLIFNYLAVKSVCLPTLNEHRFIHVVDCLFRTQAMPSPMEVNRAEAVVELFGRSIFDTKLNGYKIKLGESLEQLTLYTTEAKYFMRVRDIYAKCNYILVASERRKIVYVFLKKRACVSDELLAYFHAILAARVIQMTRESATSVSDIHVFEDVLDQSTLLTERDNSSNASLKPSLIMMNHLHHIVMNNRRNLEHMLVQAGWDIRRHSLVIGEWRVCDS